MHGIPGWFGWLIEYWPLALFLAAILAVYLVGVVVCVIKGWTFKIAAVWPLHRGSTK